MIWEFESGPGIPMGGGTFSWFLDDDQIFQLMDYQMKCADPFSSQCMVLAPRPGPNGTIQVFLPGGSISYSDSGLIG